MEKAPSGLREQHVRRVPSQGALRFHPSDVLSNGRGRIAARSCVSGSDQAARKSGRMVGAEPTPLSRGMATDGMDWHIGGEPKIRSAASRCWSVFQRLSVSCLQSRCSNALIYRPWLERGVLNWVIAGGESGPAARPMDPDWVRDLRDQSVDSGVAFFLKQLGGVRNKRGGADALMDDGEESRLWRQMPHPGSIA